VVVESTGGLQWRLVRSLQVGEYAVSVVNPERIWAYRRLVGRVAKTDRIGARLIAEHPPRGRVPTSHPGGHGLDARRTGRYAAVERGSASQSSLRPPPAAAIVVLHEAVTPARERLNPHFLRCNARSS
jgi:hypothetical protein